MNIFASHPAYTFSNSLGLVPTSTHPAYNFSNDLGLQTAGTHPAYTSSDDLGMIANNNPRTAYDNVNGLGLPHVQVPNIPPASTVNLKYHIDLLPVDNSNEQLGIINLEIEDAKIIPHVMPNHKNKVTPTTTQVDDSHDQISIINPGIDAAKIIPHVMPNYKNKVTPTTTQVDDSHDQISIINSRCNREKKKKLVHGHVKTFTAPTKVNSNLGERSIAASNVISSATESEESGSDMQLRFGISTGQINLSKMKSINSVYDNSPFAKILTAIARTIDSTKAIRKDENNMTFWISGIYSQGETFSMLNNPAATDQHSGLIFGTHYKHQPTQQIFGIAVDVGTSKSTVKTNKDQKTDTRMTQATLY